VEFDTHTSGAEHVHQSPEEPEFHDLSPREQGDLEMLMSGAFSPLKGFMIRQQYRSVLGRMRIGDEPDALLFPIPITLAVPRASAARMVIGSTLILRDRDHRPVAELTVQDKFSPDIREEARLVFGTDDPLEHPGVADLLDREHSGIHSPASKADRFESEISGSGTTVNAVSLETRMPAMRPL